MIRLLEEKDIDTVMDIWLKTNISAHNFIPTKYWTGNYHAVKGRFLPKSENYVFVEDDIIKAFISINEGYFIGALFVSEEYQQQNIGFNLIEMCKEKFDRLELAVYVENKKAIAFYEKCGFTIKKEQKNSDSGYSEYIMEWKK